VISDAKQWLVGFGKIYLMLHWPSELGFCKRFAQWSPNGDLEIGGSLR
jgi:hypothetical protein